MTEDVYDTPWEIEPFIGVDGNVVDYHVVDECGDQITMPFTDRKRLTLIAAAPELLEALEGLLAVIPLLVGGDRTELDEAEEKAHTIVAKAKGE